MIARLSHIALAGALAVTALPAAAQLASGSPSYQFLDAVKNAKGSDVESILAKPGSRIIDTQDPSTGEGALHIVARRDDSKYLSYLLAKGANPNIKNRQGDTPLLVAIDRGYDDLIPILIKYKANPNLAGDGGQTPLIKAVLRRDEQMVRDLIEGGADPDKRDYMAGKSARDYANADTRNPTMIKLFADLPTGPKRGVSGPTLR
ncbi:MAG: ankyrin repeat domain-containing protein [Sphingomonas sp.]|uniref:ankyrin repeat domain-containing protein n=1 Tax=Sphingomonas sp. TaxID=28214 RepID=UPI003F7DA428